MKNSHTRSSTLAVFSSVLWMVGCATGDQPGVQAASPALSDSDGAEACASAVLRDAYGSEVGRISFNTLGDVVRVDVQATLSGEAEGGIRGMHIHANDKPENGEGCIADPSQPANTHFASADGHFSAAGHTHGHHAGDMPALFFSEAGEAASSFITDRFKVADIRGRVVLIHEQADNYGNIPVGDQPEQYTPNDPAATDLTARTGNAGNRYACGVIE